MRLAIVDHLLMQPPTGGCQTFLLNLAAVAATLGTELEVFAEPGTDDSVAASLRSLGVRVDIETLARTDLPEERARRLAACVGQRCCDAFLISVSPDVGWLALPSLARDIPTLAVVHTDNRTFYNPLSYYAPFVDRAVGVSRETHRRIIAECQIPAPRAALIPYGVSRISEDLARARWTEEPVSQRVRIGYVGRLEQVQKRVLDLAALAAELLRRKVPFRVDVIGDGSDRETLMQQVRQAGLLPHFRFHGWLAPDAVQAKLLDMDTFVLFSDFEGLPNALLEAMSHAVVPIVTHIPSGHADVVRSTENGFLVPVGDIAGFADAVQVIALDATVRRRLRWAAWETSAAYTREAMALSYLQLIERVSAPHERAPRPEGDFPVMPSCRSRYPRFLRRLKARVRALT